VGRVRITSISLVLTGLRSVIYPSSDLEADKAWWACLLCTQPYCDQPFYVGFNVAGYELALLPDADLSDGALVYWGVDNVPTAVQAAIAGGSMVHTPVADVGEDIVTASVRTPGGAILGLIDNPHFQGG
jgi:hypothetical protein